MSARTLTDLRSHATTWVVVAVGIGMASVVHETPGLAGGHARIVVLHAFDIVLAVAVVLLAPSSLRTLRVMWRRPGVTATVALGAAVAISTLLHPSLKSGFVAFRVLAGVLLAGHLSTLTRAEMRRRVVAPMMVVAGLQGVLAFTQLQFESALGTGSLGGGTPSVVNGVLRAPGVIGHPYVLAAYGLLALSLAIAYRPDAPGWRWHLGTAASVVPVALSFGRSVLLGFVLVVIALLTVSVRDRRWRSTLAATLVGFFVPAALFAGSWTTRLDQTSTGDAVGVGTNIRIELAGDAVELIRQEWLLGLGPGHYSIELERRLDVDTSNAYPVHSVPLYLLAELGLVLGGVVLVLVGRAVVAAARAGTGGVALVLAPAGLVLFDVLHLVVPAGQVLLLVGLGAIAQITSSARLASGVADRVPG